MSEIITMPKFYSNREVAEILGCAPETVRQVKSRKAEQVAGLWDNNNPDGETCWSEAGLNKLSELINTEKAKEFRAGALARRTQEAIAADRAALEYGNGDNSLRTSQVSGTYEVQSPTGESGRYAGLTERLGAAIAGQMIAKGAIAEIDMAVVNGLLKGLEVGDIDVDSILQDFSQ
ncbi:DNA-binding protein [Tumidithrix helvetica PCC 7403]|uniref:hypothetical protein n=1 Tax=Tumidithrix helvetica TaxID=3457545 RepID=UPI003C84832C